MKNLIARIGRSMWFRIGWRCGGIYLAGHLYGDNPDGPVKQFAFWMATGVGWFLLNFSTELAKTTEAELALANRRIAHLEALVTDINTRP